jgi:hypothetical protein
MKKNTLGSMVSSKKYVLRAYLGYATLDFSSDNKQDYLDKRSILLRSGWSIVDNKKIDPEDNFIVKDHIDAEDNFIVKDHEEGVFH